MNRPLLWSGVYPIEIDHQHRHSVVSANIQHLLSAVIERGEQKLIACEYAHVARTFTTTGERLVCGEDLQGVCVAGHFAVPLAGRIRYAAVQSNRYAMTRQSG